MRQSGRRSERPAGSAAGNGREVDRPHRTDRGVLAAIGATIAAVIGPLAAIAGPPVLAASLAVAALVFTGCWLAAIGAAHVVARVFARR